MELTNVTLHTTNTCWWPPWTEPSSFVSLKNFTFQVCFFPYFMLIFFHSPGISLKPPTFHLITCLFWLFFHTALQRIKYPLDCIVHLVLFIYKVCLYWKSSVRWAESCLLWDHYLKEVFYRECWALLFRKVLLFRISSA